MEDFKKELQAKVTGPNTNKVVNLDGEIFGDFPSVFRTVIEKKEEQVVVCGEMLCVIISVYIIK